METRDVATLKAIGMTCGFVLLGIFLWVCFVWGFIRLLVVLGAMQ